MLAIALAPASEAFSVVRALRTLRVLRLVSSVPSLRKVVGALLRAIPGISAIGGLLLLIFYVFSVIATKLFGETFPHFFGGIGESMQEVQATERVKTVDGVTEVVTEAVQGNTQTLAAELAGLRAEVGALRAALKEHRG